MLLIFGIFSIASAQVQSDQDGQVWSTVVIEGSLSKNSKVSLEKELRFGNNFSDYYYSHFEGSLAYKVFSYLSLGVGYREVYEQKNRAWFQEHRPAVFVIFHKDRNGVKFEDRNRFEYRLRENTSHMWRYRNKLNAVLPYRLSRFKFQPFLSDEIFIDMNKGEFSRNRFFVGLKYGFNKKLSTEKFYLFQISRTTNAWQNFHVAGVKIKFTF